MAVRFDADAEDYTRSSASFAFGTCTFTCWVYIDTDRNAFSTAWDVDDGGSNVWLLQTDADGTTWALFDGTTGQSTLFAATPGVWYFIAVSKQTGANATVAYWAAAGDAALSSATSTHAQSATVGNLRIGESIASGEWLNGRIAALKMWTAALTQAEIENEWRQYAPHRTANLYGFYPFLEGGAVAGAQQDFSGNGNVLSGGTNSATADGPPIAWRSNARRIIAPTEEVEVLKGTDILDFGAFPGKSDASVNITGQTAIISGSLVEAWIRPADTADHSADEHMVETLHVFAGNIIAGTGFTIYGVNTSELSEPPPVHNEAFRDSLREPINDRKGTRIYGQWRVAWAWA